MSLDKLLVIVRQVKLLESLYKDTAEGDASRRAWLLQQIDEYTALLGDDP